MKVKPIRPQGVRSHLPRLALSPATITPALFIGGLVLLSAGALAAWGLAGLMAPGVVLILVGLFGNLLP